MLLFTYTVGWMTVFLSVIIHIWISVWFIQWLQREHEQSLWVRNDHCESITSKQASTTRNTARTESVHHYSCLLIYIYIYIYWYLLQWRIDGWSSCNFGGSFTGPFEPSQNMFCGDGPGIKLVWCVIGRSCFGHQDWWNCCTKEDANGKWKRWLFFCILLHFYFRFILYDLYDTLLCRCCVHCTNIYIYVQNTCCGPSIPFYRQSVCVVESVQNTCCGPSITFYRQSNEQVTHTWLTATRQKTCLVYDVCSSWCVL